MDWFALLLSTSYLDFAQRRRWPGRGPLDRSIMLAEDHAGDVCAVMHGGPTAGRTRDQRLKLAQLRGGQAGMGAVHRAIQQGDADLWVALRLVLQRAETGDCLDFGMRKR